MFPLREAKHTDTSTLCEEFSIGIVDSQLNALACIVFIVLLVKWGHAFGSLCSVID